MRQSIVDMLLIAGSPRAPDVFKIDMDIYNISVVDALLQSGTFTPRQILMEINEKTPPPIQFAIHQYEPFGWKGDHCFGISIEKVARILVQHEYIPVALDWNNLCSISRSTQNSMPRSADVRLDSSTQSLYGLGYYLLFILFQLRVQSKKRFVINLYSFLFSLKLLFKQEREKQSIVSITTRQVQQEV
jgi:hypothetical protein